MSNKLRNNGSTTAGRSSDGKFAAGNPGRPRGARHKASMAVEQLLDGEAEALGRKAIELALAGDITALRLCLERVCPARRDAPVVVDLPQMSSARDAADAIAVITAVVARGELTPQEGAAFAGLIGSYRQTLEVVEVEQRVSELEKVMQRLPPAFHR